MTAISHLIKFIQQKTGTLHYAWGRCAKLSILDNVHYVNLNSTVGTVVFFLRERIMIDSGVNT